MSDPSTEPFFWGAATASYQIEGAAAEGGPLSVDLGTSLLIRPGKSSAAKRVTSPAYHYHRYKEDVALMRDLGIQAYRFSISWSGCCPKAKDDRTRRASTFTIVWSMN